MTKCDRSSLERSETTIDDVSDVRRAQAELARWSAAAPHMPYTSVVQRAASSVFSIAAVTAVLAKSSAQTPGVDGVTRDDFVPRNDQLIARAVAASLRSGARWAPLRLVKIPKADGTSRYISMPTVFDRMRERALHLALAPIAEQRMAEQSHGFRLGRGPLTALDAALHIISNPRTRTIVETDVSSFFSGLRHDDILERLSRHVRDPQASDLIASSMRRAPVGSPRATRGLPQGSGLSPLLANIAFHDADTFLSGQKHVVDFSRYADDVLIGVEGDVSCGEEVLAWYEQFLKKNYDLAISYKKTFVRPVTEKNHCLGHVVWRAGDGGAKIEPLPDRVIRLKEALTYISNLEVADKEKNKRMNAAAAGWAGYYQPRHRVEQLAAAVLAEVKASARRSPRQTVHLERPGPEEDAHTGGTPEDPATVQDTKDQVTGLATRQPVSSAGAATDGRPGTDDESLPCAAPARTKEIGLNHPHPRLGEILTAINNLAGTPRTDLVRALGLAVAHLSEVKHELAELQLKIGRLQDKKRRRIAALKKSTALEALSDDYAVSGRERALLDKNLTLLIMRIRDLESMKNHLEAEGQTCEFAVRVLGYAIELPAMSRQ